jgi:cysteinyl-tRNA synthetase
MSLSVLGPAIDVLSGGADLRYPHHAYQMAMAQALTGVRPNARAIFEVGVVRMDGAKMAKSTGNLVLVSDVLAEHPAAALRLCLINRPWAEAWDYESAELDAATARLEQLYRAAGRGGSPPDAAQVAAAGAITAALRDDLDVPTALAVAEDAGGAAARSLISTLGLSEG